MPKGHVMQVAALLLLAGCASQSRTASLNASPALSGRYQTVFIIRTSVYSGTIDFSTGAGGALSASLQLHVPIAIAAQLAAGVATDSVNFSGPYATPQCKGTMRGRGRLEPNAAGASGVVEMQDGCVGPLAGTFSIKR